ncbi:DUF500-domain-containing protein [Testicularia cyperi]|uniref:DUF500-domain-containing protein n=1 Tax=Testicularia cyperi TaxID=1882483 RepID=A0A317XR59_9BASI|nr:DUF500-domain-containing protein [Testicularia cyperi]
MGNPLPVHLPQECAKAAKILNEFVDPVNGLDKIVPLSVLQRAKGFAIFSVFRIGFILSARAGSGVVIVKTEEGRWSAPAAIAIGGLGGGFNAGAEVTDFLVVLNSRAAVKSFMATGSLQLGGNLSVAVGPIGRSAEASGSVNTKGRVAAMFSYSKSKGFYGGISLEGTVLLDREDANFKAYGRYGKNAKQILAGSVDFPQWANGLISTIDRFTLANTPSKDLDGEYFNYDDTSSFDDRGLAGSSGRRASIDSLNGRDYRDVAKHGGRSSTGPGNGSRRASNGKAGYTDTYDSLDDPSTDRLANRFDDFGLDDDKPTKSRSKPVDTWDDDERRRREDTETRNPGPYAFGSPSSSLSNTPARVGSAASQKKRPGIRQRSSSIASNLSFSSLGRKKLDRSGPTPPPDWDDIPGQSKNVNAWGRRETDGLDELDRELQGGGGASSARRSPMQHNKSYSVSNAASASGSYGGYGGSGDGNRARGASLSHSGRGTPAGWSQFSAPAGDDDDDDDIFGGANAHSNGNARGAATSAHDPFADLSAGLEPKWTGTSSNSNSSSRAPANGSTAMKPKWENSGYGGSMMRGTAPPPTKSPSSMFGRNTSYRTPSPGSNAFGRRKTPTVTEDEHDAVASLIDPDNGDDEATYDTLVAADPPRGSNAGFGGVGVGVGTGMGMGIGEDDHSLSNTNANVPIVQRVVALFDFDAQEEGDLGFQKGQVIAVTKKTQSTDDWWQGRVEAGYSASKIGIFPANYTQPV